MVAEINRGSKIFWDAPLAQKPTILDPKKWFLATCFSHPSSVPNLKLPDSTVAEINGGPKFFGCSLAQTLAEFGPKSGFWKPTFQTQVLRQI